MKQKVILISGTQMRVGKSTLAKLLFKHISSIELEKKQIRHTLPTIGIVRRYAFASPIKEIAREYLFWDGQTKGDAERLMFQLLGTEVGRGYDINVWVKHFNKLLQLDVNQFETYATDDENEDDFINVYIVDDWRFENEANAIEFPLEGDIYKIRVDRDVDNPDDHTSHASENGLPSDPDYYDFMIDNNFETIKNLESSDTFKNLLDELMEFFIK